MKILGDQCPNGFRKDCKDKMTCFLCHSGEKPGNEIINYTTKLKNTPIMTRSRVLTKTHSVELSSDSEPEEVASMTRHEREAIIQKWTKTIEKRSPGGKNLTSKEESNDLDEAHKETSNDLNDAQKEIQRLHFDLKLLRQYNQKCKEQSRSFEKALKDGEKEKAKLEKELSLKNKSLESMTLNCQNLQADLSKLNEAYEESSKKSSALSIAFLSKNEEIKKLKLENQSHVQALKAMEEGNLFPRSIDDIEVVRAEVDALKKEKYESKVAHTKVLNQKNSEIRSLKDFTSTVEQNSRVVQEKNRKLNQDLMIREEELDRVKNLECLLVKELKSNQNKTDVSQARNCSSNHLNSSPPSNQAVPLEDIISEGAKNDGVEMRKDSSDVVCEQLVNENETPCHEMFMEGVCNLKDCQRSHTIDLKKVRRGICAQNFSSAGSCSWGDNCMFSHQIPPEVFKNKRIVVEQENILEQIKSRKNKPSYRRDTNQANQSVNNTNRYVPMTKRSTAPFVLNNNPQRPNHQAQNSDSKSFLYELSLFKKEMLEALDTKIANYVSMFGQGAQGN